MRKSIAVLVVLFAFPLSAQSAKHRELAAQLLTLIDMPGVLNENRDVLAPDDVYAALAPVLVDVYASRFTEAELAELIAFYNTPVGKKLATQSPQLDQEIAEKTRKALEPLLDKARVRATPWRGTVESMHAIAVALKQWATDNDNAYPETNFKGLESLLVPHYLPELPKKDAWGNEFYYIASGYGRHYRLVSAGSDGAFEHWTRQITERGDEFEEPELTTDLANDIVHANGAFMRLPRVAVPTDQ